MSVQRIILAGGGTAGSVTPLLAVAEHLRQERPQVELLFLGTDNGPERMLAESASIAFRTIPAGKLRRYWSWQNLGDLLHLWRGFLASRKIIKEWKPDVILSAGSYVAVPVAWAGHWAGCRVVIHQQDVRPGLANRLMMRAADTITVSFLTSVKDFKHRHVVYTGNPVRSAILSGSVEQGRELFHLDPHLPTVLVLGGGTGSRFINTLVSSVAHRLVEHVQIIHLTGPLRDWPELQHRRYHRYNFLTWQIPHAMAVATIVISRAGLGTMTELAALGKPTVFIPLPDTHQEDNASLVEELKAGIVLEQHELDENVLLKTIIDLVGDQTMCQVYGGNLHQLYRADAVAHLAAIVLNEAAS